MIQKGQGDTSIPSHAKQGLSTEFLLRELFKWGKLFNRGNYMSVYRMKIGGNRWHHFETLPILNVIFWIIDQIIKMLYQFSDNFDFAT